MVPISSFYQDFRGRKVSFRKKQFFVMKNGADRGLSFVFMKNYAFDLNLKFQANLHILDKTMLLFYPSGVS